MREVGVGLVGSGFVAEIHAEAFKHVPRAAVLGVSSPTEANVRAFAERHAIPSWHVDHRALFENGDIDVVCIGAPNDRHCEIVVDAARAGKHVICEKPMARTLAEADEMLAACNAAGVLLMYAEELCFAPKYVRAKQLVDEGALGGVYLVKQGEQHFGPHADWFWDVDRSGGGVLMDMGCHGIEFCRWIYDKPKVLSVSAELGTFVHGARTRGDDHAVTTIRFEGDRIGLVENSWARLGGMDDRMEIQGSKGLTSADLLRGSSLQTFSEIGYGYAVEKAPDTQGWTFTMFEEIWNYGFPQEMRHFIDCLVDDEPPLESGEDGRAVLELIYAAYLSAGRGVRVDLPLELPVSAAQESPIHCWPSPPSDG